MPSGMKKTRSKLTEDMEKDYPSPPDHEAQDGGHDTMSDANPSATVSTPDAGPSNSNSSEFTILFAEIRGLREQVQENDRASKQANQSIADFKRKFLERGKKTRNGKILTNAIAQFQ